jgi:outer membrane protein with beta-barrel domain
MPNNKFAVTVCVLLLLTLALHGSASAQSAEMEKKLEVGAQISGLAGGNFGDREMLGGGGRVTYNLNKFFALEGELNYFSSNSSNDLRKFQGQFGIKSGLRYKKFGLFGKVRPGFINTKQDTFVFLPTPCFSTTGSVCAQVIVPFAFNDSYTGFSLDVGGVAELYPSKRIVLRLDVGDTIHNQRGLGSIPIPLAFTGQQPPVLAARGFAIVPSGAVTSHNLQLSVGVGFRF